MPESKHELTNVEDLAYFNHDQVFWHWAAYHSGAWILGTTVILWSTYVISRRIRQQAEAEHQLRDGEAKMRAITNSAQDAILMMDANGAITFWNPAAESILGYQSNDVIGHNLHQLLAPERFIEAHRAAFPDFVRTGRGQAVGKTVELAARRKDGQEIAVSLSLSAVQIDDKWHAVGILRDISDQKRSAEVLHHSMQQMELALQGADLGTWDWNLSTGEATFNRRWAEMLGYTLDEIRPNVQTWKDLVHPEDLPSVMHAVKLHLEGETGTYETEHRLRHKSGEWIWVLDRGRVLERDDDGKPIRMCGTHLDTTERRRYELLLHRRTAQQAAIAKFGQYALSERSIDALFNKAVGLVSDVLGTKFVKILEHKPEEEILFLRAGTGWKKGLVGHTTVPDGANSQGGYTLQQAEPVIATDILHESRFRPPSLLTEHNVVCGMTVAIPGRDRPFGILGVHHDEPQTYGKDDTHFLAAMANVLAAAIHRAQTLEDIQRAETKFRTVYESSNDAIMMLDETGFFDCNAAAVRLFGFRDKTDCCGRMPDELSPALQPCGTASTTLARQHVANAARDGSDRFEWVHERSDTGVCFPVEVLLNRMELNGETAYHTVIRDISDRRQAELKLQKSLAELEESNRKAEAATRAKSEFLANMSHEIRTPMTAILGFTEVLLGEEDQEKVPSERIQALQTILRNGEYLLQLINDILDLSKIEAGKLEVEHTTCEPCQVLADVHSLMQNRAQAKNIALEIEYLSSMPRMIRSDSMRLRQILINLVGNAIKFTETGSVRITARLLQSISKPPR
ncbi:MAG: PAS domain S-box protein, partial [Pirellulales bacterium]|nr:PAS domain S-box protein [Pirellulales bacterium]